MAATLAIFQGAEEYIFNGTIHLWEDPFKVMLTTSVYDPDPNGDTVFADVTNEIAADGGYTAGGWALTGMTISRTGSTTVVSVDNLTKTATGGNIPAWRYAVVYADVTRNTVVKPLLCYLLGDDTPADVPATLEDLNFIIQWNPSGLWVS